jgi:hypothetical protein
MVHALREGRRMLKPDGILLEMHAYPVPPAVEIHAEGLVLQVGHVEDRSDFAEERSASRAVESVMAEGLFTRRSAVDYEFELQADTFDELLDWLGENWETVYTPETVVTRARQEMARARDAVTILRMAARMDCLVPARPQLAAASVPRESAAADR